MTEDVSCAGLLTWLLMMVAVNDAHLNKDPRQIGKTILRAEPVAVADRVEGLTNIGNVVVKMVQIVGTHQVCSHIGDNQWDLLSGFIEEITQGPH